VNDIGVTDEQIADIRERIINTPGLPTGADLRRNARQPDRRRVVRRQWAIAAAAVVAVVALLGTVSVVGTWRKQQAAAGLGGLLCDVLMVDTRDIYLVLNPTVCNPSAGASTFRLAHTTNGGLTWQTSSIPSYTNNWQAYPGSGAILLDKSTLLSDGFISHDSGQTWAPIPSSIRTISQVPAGWPVFWSGDSVLSLVAVDPRNGEISQTTSPAAGAPAGFARRVRPATDGSLWSSCPTNGQPGVTVSRDRGQTWPCVMLTALADTMFVDSFDGKTAYAVGDRLGRPTHEVFASSDGGLSWHLKGAGSSIGDPTDQPLVRADGVLIGIHSPGASGTGPLVASNGSTYAPISGLPQVTRLERGLTSGYRVLGADRSEWISDDGVTFTRMPLPTGVKVG
jgi:hypothetical protein